MHTQVVDFFVPNGYMRREEVMKQLDVSDATVERMARDERLKSKLVPVPGRKGERVYLSDDVEQQKRLKEKRRERQAQSIVALAPKPKPILPVKAELSLGGESVEMLRGVLEKIRLLPPPVPVTEKLWLTWNEASDLAGIPHRSLRKLCGDGRIHAEKFGRAWRVQRVSLQSFSGQ